MAPFGYVAFRIDSPFPPAEVAVRLAATTEPTRWPRFGLGRPARSFEGEVGPAGFRVSRITYDRRPTYVVVEGRVDPTPGGSAVGGTVALSASGVIFAAWFLGFAGLAAAVGVWVFVRDGLAGEWRPALLAAVVLPAAGWAGWAGWFWREVGRSLAALREVAGATP